MASIDLAAIAAAADVDVTADWGGRELRFRMAKALTPRQAKDLTSKADSMTQQDILVELARIAGCETSVDEIETIPAYLQALLLEAIGKEISLGES